MNWGNSIVLVFVVFAAIMVSMVTICMQQEDLHLVVENYYEEELKYQDHIDQVSNAKALGHNVLEFDNALKTIDLKLPIGAKGTLHLFRPSDAKLDQKLAIDITQLKANIIDISDLKPGYWRVKLTWTNNGSDYYQEEKINI